MDKCSAEDGGWVCVLCKRDYGKYLCLGEINFEQKVKPVLFKVM